MRKTIIIGALCALLAIPALAFADKIRQSGKIVGDDASKITLRVTKNGGDITKISGFKAEGVLIRCESGNDEFGFTITGSIEVNDQGSFRARLPNVSNPQEKLRVSGKVKNGGKTVVGNIKTNKLTQNGEQCDVPKQRFNTQKV